MTDMINAKQLWERLKDVVENVKHGRRYTVLYRSRPAFDIVPVGGPSTNPVPLESDPLYQAPPVGSSASGGAPGVSSFATATRTSRLPTAAALPSCTS